MEFMDVIRKRRSIRRYKPDPVPEEEIKYIMEAARLAPSWANTQCWHFVVVTDPVIKEKLGQAGNGNKWMTRAPVIIVACADPEKPGMRDDLANYLVDMGIVVEHLILAAADRGLGTCWIGAFREDMVKEALGVPDNIRVVECIPIGYPAQDPPPRGRKSLEEVFSYNHY
jgi:nitroreductase